MDGAARLAELDDAHPELGSSMQRDIAAGREPELDAIAGAVLRAAERHHLPAPTIARLAVAVAQRAGIPPPEAAVRRTGQSVADFVTAAETIMRAENAAWLTEMTTIKT